MALVFDVFADKECRHPAAPAVMDGSCRAFHGYDPPAILTSLTEVKRLLAF